MRHGIVFADFIWNKLAVWLPSSRLFPREPAQCWIITLIVYLSDAAEKHHGSGTEWPFLLLGGLGQAKAASGRYLQYPSYGKKGQRTIGNLYNTFMEYGWQTAGSIRPLGFEH